MANIRLTASETQFVNAMNRSAGAVGQLAAELNIRLARAMREVDSLNARLQQGFGKLGDKIAEVGRKMTMALTVPLALVGGMAISAYSNIEQLKKGLDVYGVSLDEVKKTAKLPGLGLEEASQATIKFNSVRFAVDLSNRAVREFGNTLILAGRGKENIDGLANAFAQARGKGKLMAEELNQMAERLPMIRDLMKQAFGVGDAEGIRAKGINVDQFLEGIVRQMEKLPRVMGGFKVAWENIIDSLKIGSFEFFDAADKALGLTSKLNLLADWIDSVVESFKNLSPENQKLIFGLLGITAAIGPLVVAVGTAIRVYSSLFAGTGLLVAQITGVVAVLGILTYALAERAEVTNRVERASRSLADVEEEARRSIHQKAVDLQQYVDVLKSENSTLEQKKGAIKNMIAISPEYFKGLNAEKSTYDDINVAVSKYINNLELAARAQKIDAQLAVSYKIEQDLILNPESATSALQKVGAGITHYFDNIYDKFWSLFGIAPRANIIDETINKNQGTALEAIRKNQKTLEEEKKKLLAMGYSGDNPGVGGGDSGEFEAVLRNYDISFMKFIGDLQLKVKENGTKILATSAAFKNQLNQAFGAFGSNGLDLDTAGDNLKRKYDNLLERMSKGPASFIKEGSKGLNIMMTHVVTQMEQFKQTVEDMTKDLMLTIVVDTAAGIGEAIGSAIGGGGFQIGKVFSSLLSTIGSYLIEVGKQALIVQGIYEKLKLTLFTPAGIPAALATIAVGGLLKGIAGNLFKQTPKFANGGIVYGPTMGLMGEYPGASSNPEVIAPLSKLKDMIGGVGETGGVLTAEIKAETILLTLNRHLKAQGKQAIG